ncbi:MAG: dUTP diphosphatase [Bacteroidetes bacterium]|nr:dUTP diphosphatase [Bacteroidota bacterium]
MSVSISIINKSPHPLPAYQSVGAAGLDLMAWLPEPRVLQPMERALIPTGLYLALPDGYEAQIRPRSGMAFKKGITLVNAPGTIDADYRGEILLAVINLSTQEVIVQDGDRVAQMVIAKYEQASWQEVAELTETSRAAGAFGHTGF